ncbi:hypothetical protein EDD85DRAFT_1027340 [Armillaria nabsnona]|nr:hypothetical protein EDD85DRAFT_1027340 [Armillaria nabsnona]
MPPLSPLPPTSTPTQDTFSHKGDTLLSNLLGLPHLIVLLVPSSPLFDVSITISMPIYTGFRPTTTLESLPTTVRCLHFTYQSMGKHAEKKTLCGIIVNELDRLSQVWVANVRRKDKPELSYGCVLLKFFQGSLRGLCLSEYYCLRELAGTEKIVYTSLEDLQGSGILYHCGKRKFIMPNGETTRVILLEYIEGTTLAQLEDKYSSHASPQFKPVPEESYTEWPEIAKELVTYFFPYPGFDFSDPEHPPESQNAEYYDHTGT